VIINGHPNFPLVIIHNRDEYLSRKTIDAFINKETKVLAGKKIK
jgi:uncharacterized protein with NRDE domain